MSRCVMQRGQAAGVIQKVPGNFVFIGNGSQGQEGATPLHNAGYDFNDAILPVGARYFSEVVRLSLPV